EEGRRLRLLGRRAPGEYGRDALRALRVRWPEERRPRGEGGSPAGLLRPRLPGGVDGGRGDARRVEAEPARREPGREAGRGVLEREAGDGEDAADVPFP